MEGGYSSPSIIWIIPFDAIMLALSRGTAFSPNRIFPWEKRRTAHLFQQNGCKYRIRALRRQTYTVRNGDGNKLIGHRLHLGDGNQVIGGQLHIKNNDKLKITTS